MVHLLRAIIFLIIVIVCAAALVLAAFVFSIGERWFINPIGELRLVELVGAIAWLQGVLALTLLPGLAALYASAVRAATGQAEGKAYGILALQVVAFLAAAVFVLIAAESTMVSHAERGLRNFDIPFLPTKKGSSILIALLVDVALTWWVLHRTGGSQTGPFSSISFMLPPVILLLTDSFPLFLILTGLLLLPFIATLSESKNALGPRGNVPYLIVSLLSLVLTVGVAWISLRPLPSQSGNTRPSASAPAPESTGTAMPTPSPSVGKRPRKQPSITPTATLTPRASPTGTPRPIPAGTATPTPTTLPTAAASIAPAPPPQQTPSTPQSTHIDKAAPTTPATTTPAAPQPSPGAASSPAARESRQSSSYAVFLAPFYVKDFQPQERTQHLREALKHINRVDWQVKFKRSERRKNEIRVYFYRTDDVALPQPAPVNLAKLPIGDAKVVERLSPGDVIHIGGQLRRHSPVALFVQAEEIYPR